MRAANRGGHGAAAACVASVALLALSSPLSAVQSRDIVSSRVEISSGASSLRLEYSDGNVLDLRLAGGTAFLNGEPIGAFEPGGSADRAWRELLDRALGQSDADLARELEGWSADPATEGREARLLGLIQDLLAADGWDADADRADRLQDRARQEREGAELARAQDMARQALLEADVARLRELVRQGLLDQVEPDLDVEELRRQIREQVRSELESELARSEAARRDRSDGVVWTFFSRVLDAVADLFQTLAAFIFLAALTYAASRVAGDRIDAVTREVGHRPGRAAVVGAAGGFLSLPLYIIGIFGLVITVVGILLVPFWAVMFPLALAVAVLVGGAGVFHHVGRWVLGQRISWLDRVDRSRDVHVRLVGLAALMAPSAVGGLLTAVPLLRGIGFLVEALGAVAVVATAVVGLGAVIVTRGGRHVGQTWRSREPSDDDLEIDFGAAYGDFAEEEPDADFGAAQPDLADQGAGGHEPDETRRGEPDDEPNAPDAADAADAADAGQRR